ncbi:MAG: ABC transporter permease [Deltaproteobacteria bacterium]|nr:ABC transporter permease [Deltaproteobacteria bacterium]MBL7075340.1 ABC transporter permease [candidate division KSB1 bacterium]
MNRQRGILYLMIFMGMLWIGGVVCSKFAPHNPLEILLSERLTPPNKTYLCGTDELGRDIFSRILVGFSNTMNVSIMTLFSSFFIGVLIGPLAGFFYNTVIDRLFNWVAAMLFSLPFLLIITALMSLLEKNLFNAYAVMTAIIWVSPARIVRAGVIKAKSATFVVAERAMGKSESTILFRSLIPMSIRPAFIFSFKYFPEIIGMEAGLSFLGLGVQPPHPGLGKMIFDSLNYLYSGWWYAFFPAFFLFVIVFLSNMVYRWVSGRAAYTRQEV